VVRGTHKQKFTHTMCDILHTESKCFIRGCLQIVVATCTQTKHSVCCVACTQANTHMHTHTYMRMHTYMHKHKHTHTHTLASCAAASSGRSAFQYSLPFGTSAAERIQVGAKHTTYQPGMCHTGKSKAHNISAPLLHALWQLSCVVCELQSAHR